MILFIFLFFFIFPKYAFAIDNSIVVLMYHRFNQTDLSSTNINTDEFVEQMSFLKKNNYTVLPLSSLISFFQKKEKLPNKTVFITIDDGYKSVYQYAYPILKSFEFPFSVFLSTNFVSNEHNSDFMSWEMIKEMHLDNVEIFNHTSDHESLLDQNEEEIIESISNAQDEIKKNLDILPSIFSYPYGENSEKTKFILKKIGFDLAFTQNSGPISIYSDQYFLPRFPINSEFGSIERFKMVVNTKPLNIFNFSPDDTIIKTDDLLIEFTSGYIAQKINCYISNSARIIEIKNHSYQKYLKISGLEKKKNYRLNCTLVKNKEEVYWFGKTFYVREN